MYQIFYLSHNKQIHSKNIGGGFIPPPTVSTPLYTVGEFHNDPAQKMSIMKTDCVLICIIPSLINVGMYKRMKVFFYNQVKHEYALSKRWHVSKFYRAQKKNFILPKLQQQSHQISPEHSISYLYIVGRGGNHLKNNLYLPHFLTLTLLLFETNDGCIIFKFIKFKDFYQ